MFGKGSSRNISRVIVVRFEASDQVQLRIDIRKRHGSSDSSLSRDKSTEANGESNRVVSSILRSTLSDTEEICSVDPNLSSSCVQNGTAVLRRVSNP